MLAIAYVLSTFSAITILTSYSAHAQLLQLQNISNGTNLLTLLTTTHEQAPIDNIVLESMPTGNVETHSAEIVVAQDKSIEMEGREMLEDGVGKLIKDSEGKQIVLDELINSNATVKEEEEQVKQQALDNIEDDHERQELDINEDKENDRLADEFIDNKEKWGDEEDNVADENDDNVPMKLAIPFP
jgi:hypothetical protein